MKVMKKALLLSKKIPDSANQEKAILSVIHHPFLVTLRYAFQSHTKLYLVMDYVARRGAVQSTRLPPSPSNGGERRPILHCGDRPSTGVPALPRHHLSET